MTINVSYFAYTNAFEPRRVHKTNRPTNKGQNKMTSPFFEKSKDLCLQYYNEAKSFLDFHKNWSESSEQKHAVFCRASRVKIACENVKTKSHKIYCMHTYKSWKASIHERGLNFH